MDAGIEQRQFRRDKCHGPLTYQFTIFGESYTGSGIDCSDGGLSFKSRNEIKPGTIVYIRHLNCGDCDGGNEGAAEYQTLKMATVKWSRERLKNSTSEYHNGAMYIVSENNPVY